MAIGFAIWVVSPVRNLTHPDDPALTRAAEETSFITVWVVAAFLAYEYLDQFAGLDLAAAFKAAGPALPLIAIAVGFIPGCGPQVLVTTLYINGLIPFAALLGNAIANDGDALFPALALTPRAAIDRNLVQRHPGRDPGVCVLLFPAWNSLTGSKTKNAPGDFKPLPVSPGSANSACFIRNRQGVIPRVTSATPGVRATGFLAGNRQS